MSPLFGGVDCGGTKFLCVVGTSPDDIRASRVVKTETDPRITMAGVAEFFRDCGHLDDIAAIGLASFGPLDLSPASATYGGIRVTTKPGWDGFNQVAWLREAFGEIPVGIQTDVGGAAMAEATWGQGRGCDSLCYITVGTGVGGAHISGGRLMNGHSHSEMGHMTMRRHPDHDYPGCCKYHGDCIEGLVSGPAIRDWTGTPGEALPPDHPAFDYVAHYLGQMCANVFFSTSPERIVLGGGVMAKPGLINRIRDSANAHLAGYLYWPTPDRIGEAITVSEWVRDGRPATAHPVNAGALGGLLVAREALERKERGTP